MRTNDHAGSPREPTYSAAGFGWPGLKAGVADYLEQQGVPPAEAERFSSEIIAQCADQAEAIGVDGMDERVQSEAQTLLEGWHATRRATLLGAA